MDIVEKEEQLAQAYVDSNGTDMGSFEELCKLLRPMFIHLMERYRGVIDYYSTEDFVQIGQIVLWKVLERMRQNPGVVYNFKAYIYKAVSNRYATEFRNFVFSSDPKPIRSHESAGNPQMTITYFGDYDRYKNKVREQRKSKDKAYYERHKERILEARKKYAEEHRQQRREITRRYYQRHREEIREREKQKYHERHEEKLEYFRKYREEHRKQRREADKRYREKHKVPPKVILKV